MSRYTSISRTKAGNINVLNTVYYPNILPSNDDLIIEPPRKRLDSIAYDYYRDSELWWIIAKANNIIDGSFTVPNDLDTIRIPQNISQIISEFNRLNS